MNVLLAIHLSLRASTRNFTTVLILEIFVAITRYEGKRFGLTSISSENNMNHEPWPYCGAGIMCVSKDGDICEYCRQEEQRKAEVLPIESYGPLAQRVEHLTHNRVVTGSNPVRPTHLHSFVLGEVEYYAGLPLVRV
jgi:hypothetical protein